MLPPGTRIDDRYEVLGPLGAGGMGQVYRARRVRLGDEVAVKVLSGALEAPQDLHERFLRESQACARLKHPGIVGLLDYGVDAGRQPYMVMELLSGPSLAEQITVEGPMPPQRVAGVIGPVAAALQLAHDHGITHRDLKPANIVMHRYATGEHVHKVIDFGLAAIKSDQSTRLTDPNLFIGTMAYAAPEQIRGEPVTAAVDVYALGVITYEMLTGVRPFETDDRFSLINQVLTTRPVNPTARHPAIPAEVDDVVLRALAKAPADRWPSIAAFARALETAVGAVRDDGAAPVAAEAGLLARYELGAQLGRGRLGSVVYQGTHRALGTPVAIRVLRREEQPHWDAVRARFLLEGRTLQAAHPSLLQVRDFGEDERSVFVVSDLIDGPSLRQALEGGRFPWPRALALLSQALDAVALLNRRGGFVAGVNPDMIRLTHEDDAERIVLSTAGIRSVQDVLATMREQELRGHEASEQELPYVAPEVLMGRAPDPRADVFTIGVLGYQMVTGRLPYRASSMPELLGQMLQTTPAPAAELSPDVPPRASDALTRALAAEPSARFASAPELARALR